jgi:ribosomal protein L22
VLKRVWPRSRGSADMLRRPTCHLIVELEQTKDSKEAEG